MKRQLNEVQKDPTVSHRAQLTTECPCPSGASFTSALKFHCFPHPPHMQWGSSDAGKEQSKSLGDVVGFQASIHLGYECNLSRISLAKKLRQVSMWKLMLFLCVQTTVP